jgi:hypothetical protein
MLMAFIWLHGLGRPTMAAVSDWLEPDPCGFVPLSELVFFPDISLRKETGGHMRVIVPFLLEVS